MMDYQAAQSVIKYLDFLHSENGQIQQRVLSHAILNVLPKKSDLSILDAGCGPGWMSQILFDAGYKVFGCDSSELLIKFAKTHYGKQNPIPNEMRNPSQTTKGIPRSLSLARDGMDFRVADLEQSLPYPAQNFDVAIMNMVGPDIKNLEVAFKNIPAVLKTDGMLIMTIPNPEYSYPVAEWHRSLAEVLLMRKPKLVKKTPPPEGAEIVREFGKNKLIKSYYHSLDAYLQAADGAQLKLIKNEPVKAERKSKKFDLNYQLSLYPLIQLIVFKK